MKAAIRHSALPGSIGCANFQGHDFAMHCVACAEECLWRTDLLLRRFGHDFTVAEFSRTFTCQGCGGVGTSVLQRVDRPLEQQATRFRRMAPKVVTAPEGTQKPRHIWGLRPADDGLSVL
jgi:hypothetical protein